MFSKRASFRSDRILRSAKGKPCLIETPYCLNDVDTVVACHSNEVDDGKAGKQKADDIFTARGCAACHDFVDGRTHKDAPQQLRIWYLDRGIKRTMRALLDEEHLIINYATKVER